MFLRHEPSRTSKSGNLTGHPGRVRYPLAPAAGLMPGQRHLGGTSAAPRRHPGRAPRGQPRGGPRGVRPARPVVRTGIILTVRREGWWLIRASWLIGCTMIPQINHEALINHNKPITASNAWAERAPLGPPGPVRLQAPPSGAAPPADMAHSGYAAPILSRRGQPDGWGIYPRWLCPLGVPLP